MKVASSVKRLRKRPSDFHHGALRAAALELTAREVEAHGHTAISLEMLSAKLGVTRPALYRHFTDKRALLVEVAHLGFERFEAALTAAVEQNGHDVWAAYLAVGTTYVAHARANPGWFRLQFSHPVPVPDLRRTPARYSTLLLDALAAVLGRPEGEHAYRAMWGIAHGLASLVVEGIRFRMPRRYGSRCVRSRRSPDANPMGRNALVGT
jgi:AcrR family transcriptional regulator